MTSLDNNSDLQHDIFNTFFHIKSGLIVAMTSRVWFCAFYGNLESNINSLWRALFQVFSLKLQPIRFIICYTCRSSPQSFETEAFIVLTKQMLALSHNLRQAILTLVRSTVVERSVSSLSHNLSQAILTLVRGTVVERPVSSLSQPQSSNLDSS